jgi:hypothetical protein
MRKILLLGAIVFTAVIFVGAQNCFAWSNVNQGCTGCHLFPAGGGLHTKSGHSNCSSCHDGSPGKGNVMSAKCAGCHPQESPGKCNLANIATHPKSGAQSCVSCHCQAATTTVPATTTTTTPDGGTTTTTTPSETTTTTVPAEECSLNIFPGTYSVGVAFIFPIQFFVITAPLNSNVSFADPICIYWDNPGIDDIIKLRLGEKLIFGFVELWPAHLTSGEFKVHVTYGDISETRCGPIIVRQ